MREARTRAGEVVVLSGKQLFIHSSQFHVWTNVNHFNYVFHVCRQLINNMDRKAFAVCALGSAETKEECSSDYSISSKNDGILLFIYP